MIISTLKEQFYANNNMICIFSDIQRIVFYEGPNLYIKVRRRIDCENLLMKRTVTTLLGKSLLLDSVRLRWRGGRRWGNTLIHVIRLGSFRHYTSINKDKGQGRGSSSAVRWYYAPQETANKVWCELQHRRMRLSVDMDKKCLPYWSWPDTFKQEKASLIFLG